MLELRTEQQPLEIETSQHPLDVEVPVTTFDKSELIGSFTSGFAVTLISKFINTPFEFSLYKSYATLGLSIGLTLVYSYVQYRRDNPGNRISRTEIDLWVRERATRIMTNVLVCITGSAVIQGLLPVNSVFPNRNIVEPTPTQSIPNNLIPTPQPPTPSQSPQMV